MLPAPITPAGSWGGLDFSKGVSNPKGMTIDEINASGCLTFTNDVPPNEEGGYRGAYFGQQDLVLSYNVQSRVIHMALAGGAYKGTAKFKSRDGAHNYEVGVAVLKKDGADMTIDWTGNYMPVLNELYDALIATFSPSTAPVADCKKVGACLVLPLDVAGSGQAFFGARPIPFYLIFGSDGHVSGLYSFWPGGKADCSTPIAAREAADFAPIYQGYADVSVGPTIGGLYLSKKQSNPNGMTAAEADAILCGGVPASAPDNGYRAMKWGASGEILLEYNATSQVVFKVFVTDGYKGTLDGTDGIGNKYSIGIGKITKNDQPFQIDWTDPKARMTELSNAVNSVTEPDCLASGSCTYAADDGAGHSMFGFPNAQIYVLVTKGTSTPVEIFTIWTKGQ
jgi:hypothetical protein